MNNFARSFIAVAALLVCAPANSASLTRETGSSSSSPPRLLLPRLVTSARCRQGPSCARKIEGSPARRFRAPGKRFKEVDRPFHLQTHRIAVGADAWITFGEGVRFVMPA